MNVWIISESDDITARVRKSLQKLRIESPLAQVVSAVAVSQIRDELAEPRVVIFFATASLSATHLDVVHQVRSLTDAKLVVISSESDHTTILKAIRAGASDHLNADGNLDDEILELVSRVEWEQNRRSSKGRLITVLPCHAPVDASVVAVNVAAITARNAGTCCLLDFQLRGGDLAMLLKLVPKHTLYDLITESDGIDEAMFQQALTPHVSGIRLLAGPRLFSDFVNIQPQVCQQILNLALTSHPFAVVNLEDVLHAEQVRVLTNSDEIVLTMRLDIVSLRRAQQHMDFLKDLPVSLDRIHVVAMGTGHNSELPEAAVRRFLGISIIHCIPDDPVNSIMSINIGNPLVLECTNSRVAQAMIRFAHSFSASSNTAEKDAKPKTLSGVKAAAVLTLNMLPFCK